MVGVWPQLSPSRLRVVSNLPSNTSVYISVSLVIANQGGVIVLTAVAANATAARKQRRSDPSFLYLGPHQLNCHSHWLVD